ncbi:hypothetical protein C2E23DRAFT_864143 [Lenzites betulinus]|nr:hypothetical protein C2E23DRAFT_864143 [Lenzites betulinus]
MSNRYNFRARAGATAATPQEPQVLGEPQPVTPATHVIPLGSPLTRSSGSTSLTGGVHPGSERRPGVSYSQAAGSRPSSPSQGAGQETASADEYHSTPFPRADPFATTATNRKHRVTVEDITDEDSNNGPWKTVVRRRTRSVGSLPRNSRLTSATPTSALTAAQQAAVRVAETRLTNTEREHVGRRMQIVAAASARDDSSSSRGQGPSRDKGKTIDARNWGAAGIPEEELSPDVQRREFDMYSYHPHSYNSNVITGYNTDEQREMLEHWKAAKAEQMSRPDAGEAANDDRPQDRNGAASEVRPRGIAIATPRMLSTNGTLSTRWLR